MTRQNGKDTKIDISKNGFLNEKGRSDIYSFNKQEKKLTSQTLVLAAPLVYMPLDHADEPSAVQCWYW